jgi:hypothetical protein
MPFNPDCDRLDAFLSDALSSEEAAQFAAHVSLCGECREAIDQQRWIDELLQSPITAGREAPPAALAGAVRTAINRPRQRAGLIAGAIAAAAALTIAVGWTALFGGGGDAKVIPPIAHADDPAGDEPADASVTVSRPRAIVTTGPEAIAVPIESPYPDITIVRIYPTYNFDGRNDSSAGPPPLDSANSWPSQFDSNGGTL